MAQTRAAGDIWPPLAAVAFIALFSALGFWQVGRYEIKQDLWNAFQQADEQPARSVTSPERLDALNPYTPVELRGRYDLARQVLLDNRIRGGRPGVEVFTPLKLDSGGMVLVNRGWLPMARDRRHKPRAPGPDGPVSVSGVVAPAPATGIRLGRIREPESWPWLTPYLLPERVQAALGRPLADSVVLLDPDAPGGFARNWSPTMLPPERHLGYAVQWFALALAVAVAWLCLTVRRNKHGR